MKGNFDKLKHVGYQNFNLELKKKKKYLNDEMS